MPWYGWLGWILMLAVVVGFCIYFLVKKKQPASLAEAKLKLNEMEKELKGAKAEATEEATARKKAEQETIEAEKKLLEESRKTRLATLKKKEGEDYEKAKADPESGVDYMRDVLGIDPDDDPSGTGPK